MPTLLWSEYEIRPNGNPWSLHPTRISRWDFLLAFSTVYWPSDGLPLSSWLVNHPLWFRLIRPAMKPSFLGGGVHLGGVGWLAINARQTWRRQWTTTSLWIDGSPGATESRRRYGKKNRGQQFTHMFFFWGDQIIWCKCLRENLGKFPRVVRCLGRCHIVMTPVVANLGPNFWQDNRTRRGRIFWCFMLLLF